MSYITVDSSTSSTTVLIFDEKLEIYHLAGTLMVFIGIFLVKKNVKNA